MHISSLFSQPREGHPRGFIHDYSHEEDAVVQQIVLLLEKFSISTVLRIQSY